MASTSSTQLPPGVSPNHPLGPLEEIIDILRTITQHTAENGPSDDLGIRIVTAGDDTEALVPVFFRCTWPAGAKSRHILIWIKPSIPNSDFGTAVNDAFMVIEAGGIIKKTGINWIDFSPFADASPRSVAARNTVRGAVGLENPPTQQQIIKMLEQTMNGIMEVIVQPAKDAARCHICREVRPIIPANMAKIRKSAFRLRIFCEGCQQKLGIQEINRINAQAEAEIMQRAQNSLSNTGE